MFSPKKIDSKEILSGVGTVENYTSNLASILLGIAFGRWDKERVNSDLETYLESPFKRIPRMPPVQTECAKIKIIEQAEKGVKLVNLLEKSLSAFSGIDPQASLHEMESILEVDSISEFYKQPSKFFGDHLKRYSSSRRQAPIYWPLQTSSSLYTLWVYYHQLNEQTLYSCVNDFVEPKLDEYRTRS